MLIGIYVVVKQGSMMSLGFTGISFVTKSMAMIFLLWLGITELELNYKIYVPLLTFFWFFTHVIEAFVIQHYIRENESDVIRSVQR
jgi:hypothetical protein|tara:strand:- start:248 stop:505 length:258 start_codon:yes stop_codon:yes gene_type:complete